MNNIMRLFIATVGFFYLTGFTGDLNVSEPLDLNARKGFNSLEEGAYGVTLNIKTPRKLALEIHVEGKENNPELEINFPRNKQLRPGLRQFQLSPAESGQKKWINGYYEEYYSRTPERYISESCTENVPVRYCYVDRYGRRVCDIRYEERVGRRDAYYFDEAIDRELTLGFANSDVEPDIAVMDAEGREIYRRYTRVGRCFVY